MRLLYVLSAAGFALFVSGHYFSLRARPQRRTAGIYTGPDARALAHHAA